MAFFVNRDSQNTNTNSKYYNVLKYFEPLITILYEFLSGSYKYLYNLIEFNNNSSKNLNILQ